MPGGAAINCFVGSSPMTPLFKNLLFGYMQGSSALCRWLLCYLLILSEKNGIIEVVKATITLRQRDDGLSCNSCV